MGLPAAFADLMNGAARGAAAVAAANPRNFFLVNILPLLVS